ncbi:imidazole glycerol phosphate synthase subunit HisH [Bizionia paragorgiae]|uniref:imidazole glycerol phosphate synthase subunit HisH n=1 Tax=Bizionia paragorgiae TaxID=283786 RepID=UPI00299E9AE3|nr:imidazole glycerol phosphate synthase subunit HisH [Bizionia paragorgiae]MDX1270760.1 imidazole glycerol phosphate synthase subunit HisH [Bizionia paragorgiae]
MNVVIIDYGAGNIKSLQYAFNRLGSSAILTNSPEKIKAADRVIFPGVGQASSAMKMLQKNKLDHLIPSLTQPVLGICLGMQLLCNTSEEGNTKGLGIFDTQVKQFSKNVKVPQVGWNTIENLKSDLFKSINDKAYMYLVHSYYAAINYQTIAHTSYDTIYASALQHNNFYGVQFHPEKSGDVGAQLLKNFLELD